MGRRTSLNTPAYVIRRRNNIVQALDSGIHWSHLGGRKLRKNPDYISLKIGQAWRILWQRSTQKYELLSHSEYDKKLSKQIN